MKNVQAKRIVLRFENGKAEQTEDCIVTEQPVTVKINGNEFVTMVCTPSYIEDMVVGYLASEGVIRQYEDIRQMRLDESGFAHVELARINPFFEKLQNKRYITSCCGMSRQGFVFANDALTAKKMHDIHVRVTPDRCFSFMKRMQEEAGVFKETGGVHNAALCDESGILLQRMDIGRHNALDKLYGYCLRNGLSTRGKILVFSGRISSEILLKAAKIGCEMVLSKSAPTELALEAAEELGITTVGFIRGGSMNVYTRPERIVLP